MTTDRVPGPGPVPEDGELTVLARLPGASNATFLAEVHGPDGPVRCVYKPVRGERPLWDFPDGTLAGREVATYRVARALGWDAVPPTIVRDGPAGPGMVQAWIARPHGIDGPDPVDLFDPAAVPEDYIPVLRAETGDGTPVVLAHADDPRLERIAVLDVIVNNPDRKGGHVLIGPGERWYAIDHGICLHAEPKLRTVLWGWAGADLDPALHADVTGLLERLAGGPGGIGLPDDAITAAEFDALVDRTAELAATAMMPHPRWAPAIPWPPL